MAIVTAPKDGTVFLGMEGDHVFACRYSQDFANFITGFAPDPTDAAKIFVLGVTPTLWLPLPQPPEPWSHMAGIKTNIIASTGVRVARCDFNGDFDNSEAHANARRIVACVNALEGVSTEALEILIAQGNGKYALNVEATQARVKELEVSFSKQYGDMKTEIDRLTIDNSLLEAQRDELLEAIERYINGYLNGNPMPILIDFLAEAHDKIETDRKSNA